MGTAIPHDSAAKHVTGEALYVDDIPLPAGHLHGFVALSTRPHARIIRLDLDPVRSAPGVAAALAASDVPGSIDIAPVIPGDPVLADGLVEYAGQAIFAVAATTEAEARIAAARAIIEYEDLPHIDGPAAAHAQQSYIIDPYEIAVGNAASALAGASHQLVGKLEIGGQDHFYLEGQIAVAVPQEDGDMLIYSSTQHPSELQHLVAKVLGATNKDVTVEVRRMGGAFGGKETQAAPVACQAALLARATGRAVKIRLDRDDDMLLTGKRHPFVIDWKVGFDGDGVLDGVAFDCFADCGFSADLSIAILDRALFHADNGYFLENAQLRGFPCKTNHVSMTAFRGFGGPQGMLGIETAIDDIARYLGRDRREIVKANLYGTNGTRDKTPYGQTVEDNILPELIDQLEASSDYRARRAEIAAFNATSQVLKRGLALTPVKFGISFTATFLNQAGALIHIYNDGSIHLNHGGTEMGQGLFTKVAQVVADEFGVPIDAVKISATHTGKVPNTSATAASSGSDLNGMAARDAARRIKARLADFAATEFGIDGASIKYDDGRVSFDSTELTFADFVRQAYVNRVSLSSSGFYATPKIAYDPVTRQGRPFFYFAYGAAVSEAIIDTLTGELKILRADILHDAGTSLNPAIDLGQIEGGYIQGLGWLTTEELWWDADGQLKTHAPSTYKIPAAGDLPDDFRVAFFSGPNREETVGRSKAVGEPPLMLAISAFMAIRDAVASVGDGRHVPSLDAPATPERILLAVEDIKSRSQSRTKKTQSASK
jgi:xanthine dehydrogenase large subunit